MAPAGSRSRETSIARVRSAEQVLRKPKRIEALEHRLKSVEERFLVLTTKLDAYVASFSKLSRMFRAMTESLDVLGLLTRSTVIEDAIAHACGESADRQLADAREHDGGRQRRGAETGNAPMDLTDRSRPVNH